LISQQEYDQSASAYQAAEANLEFTRRQLQDASIFAPFSGVMASREISPGQLISKNTIVSWLIDLDPVKVEFHVPERFLGQVKEKQIIEVGVEAFPGRKFHGEVFFVSPFVDPVDRTASVKASIPNSDRALKPGMFANLALTLTVRENSTVIPETAVSQILTNEQALVFAVENGVAQMRRVKTGIRLVGGIEILEGIKPGEKVIVEGLQKVIPGAPVRVATPAAGAEPAGNPPGDQSSPKT
jgi:membrane fusion protein (multidrug efflux system)